MSRVPSSLSCLFLAFAAVAAHPQSPAEDRASRAYDAAFKAGPLALHAFLEQFPKGADLHVHLGGAVYAETFIREAAGDGLCVDPRALALVRPPCDAPLVPASELSGALTPARQDLYDRLVDSLSMRSFVPSPGWSGHDQFFATFDRFGVLGARHLGEWVDEVASRSAAQNQQYLELMETPVFTRAAALAHDNPIDGAMDLARYRERLLSLGVRDEVQADREHVLSAERARRQIEHCGTAQAAPACRVTVRYLYQVLRGFSPEQVFAQTLLGFETVQAASRAHDDTWVGINLVMPEDGFVSMRDYTLQMRMLDLLHSLYPGVHITLHAGELAPGLVPPEGLRFHIRQAIELGHAERIGHGVDVMYEDNPWGLLRMMAERHIMVEINLSSNEGILGTKGADHPLPLYREAGVPVALSTDDEGVSRIELTGEYVRAAIDLHLSYTDLKQMARTGMEHSFLPGESLWAARDIFTSAAAPCRRQVLGGEHPSEPCRALLDGSQKAGAQWEQERRLRAFEAGF